MRVYQAIILGAIQGFTEFLPVSSSGHLILAERWLGITAENGFLFDAFLHIGTLIPVVFALRGEIKSALRPKKAFYIAVATLPAVVSGFLLADKAETAFKGGTLISAVLLSATFILTGAELFLAQKLSAKSEKMLPLSLKSSIIMGVMQGFAVLPGLSRSGTVITGGTLANLNGKDNANFAFLMSIPVILGAAALSFFKAVKGGAEIDFIPLFFGTLSACCCGFVSVKGAFFAIRKAKYTGFCVYLSVVAAASVLSKVFFGV